MKRFLLLFALAVAVAGTVASTAQALGWDDSVCPPDSSGTVKVCPRGFVSTSYSLQIKGRAGTGCVPYVKFSVSSGGLPPGLTLSSNGSISGTPTQAGDWQFYIAMHDVPASQGGVSWCADSLTSYRLFDINVTVGLTIATASVPVGTVGTSYSTTLTATPAGAQTWAVTAGALPPGLSLGASTGVIAGTPTTAGSYQFSVKVSDSLGRTARADYRLDVRAPLTITPLSPDWAGPHGSEVGVPLSATLTATGGSGTFTWSLAGGSLPTGVTLGAQGTIAGTPELAGTFPFIVHVADSEGRTATLAATLTVAPKLSFKSLPLRAAKVGKLYKAKIATIGGVLPETWKILRGKLPRGVRFDTKLATFAGTPRRKGTYRVTVEVIDGYGVTVQRTFLLVVKA